MPAPQMPQILPAAATSPRATLPTADVIASANRLIDSGDIPAAVQALGTIADAAERVTAIREIVTSRARQDSAAAARVARALPPGASQTEAMETAVRAWADRDADAALRWAIALPETAPRFSTVLALADHLVQKEGRAALERIAAPPVSPERDEALSAAVARLARRDADAALDWARALPDGELKDRLVTSIGFELAQIKPDAALAIAERLPQGRNRALLYGAIGQTWHARDANAALAWARALPNGSERDAALAGIETGSGTTGPRRIETTRRGTRRIAGGAIRERPADIASLPPGPERDRAIEKHLEQLMLTSPVLAANWLDAAPAGDRTEERLVRVARDWLRLNPAAAEAWIDQTMVLRERKRQLLRDVGR